MGEQVAALARRIAGRQIEQAPPVDQPPTALPPGTGQLLAELRAKGVDVQHHLLPVRPPAPAPDTAAPPPVTYTVEDVHGRPFVPLHVREWAHHVDALVADVKTHAPTDSRFGMRNAASSIRLAILALRTATQQVPPYTEHPTDTPYPIEPGELVHLQALLGDVHDAIAALCSATQQQLVEAYRAAQRAEITGPPGADAAVEVAAVMTTMLTIAADANAGGRECAVLAERLGRLTRTDP